MKQGRQAAEYLGVSSGPSLRSIQKGHFSPELASPSCLPFPASFPFAASSLMFCTNGVLLRMLTGAGRTPLAQVTHLVRLQTRGLGGGLCPAWLARQPVQHIQFRAGIYSTVQAKQAMPLPSLPQVVDEIHERDRFADFLLILVGALAGWLGGWVGSDHPSQPTHSPLPLNPLVLPVHPMVRHVGACLSAGRCSARLVSSGPY